MLRILMILDNGFKPDLRVQKEINTIVKLGYSVDLYCWDQEGDLPYQENLPNFNLYRIKLIVEKQQGLKKIIDLLNFYLKAYKRIKNQNIKYNYIYVHDFLMLPFGVFLKFRLKLPFIYDAHEIYHLMEWEKYPSILRSLIFFAEKTLIKFVDHFIVVSEHRKNFYSKYIHKEINVIGNWYDKYSGENKNLRKTYSLSEDAIILGYFGAINLKVRPIHKIIELMQNYTNIHFFIGGSGVDVAKLTELIKSKKNVHFLGWMENVREYFDSLDYIVYVMNRDRKYFEYTAPNTLYLAISHNKPIITNVPGEPLELVEKYKIGFFIKDIDKFSLEKIHTKQDYGTFLNNINSIKDKYLWSSSSKTYSNILR
jgi:glycosyltransferase involved in cell wall biosynthesis